jgi:hypothetical protein
MGRDDAATAIGLPPSAKTGGQKTDRNIQAKVHTSAESLGSPLTRRNSRAER